MLLPDTHRTLCVWRGGGGVIMAIASLTAGREKPGHRILEQEMVNQHFTNQQHQPRRTAQHSTAQHSTAQHSTAQHSTAQHSVTE